MFPASVPSDGYLVTDRLVETFLIGRSAALRAAAFLAITAVRNAARRAALRSRQEPQKPA